MDRDYVFFKKIRRSDTNGCKFPLTRFSAWAEWFQKRTASLHPLWRLCVLSRKLGIKCGQMPSQIFPISSSRTVTWLSVGNRFIHSSKETHVRMNYRPLYGTGIKYIQCKPIFTGKLDSIYNFKITSGNCKFGIWIDST